MRIKVTILSISRRYAVVFLPIPIPFRGFCFEDNGLVASLRVGGGGMGGGAAGSVETSLYLGN